MPLKRAALVVLVLTLCIAAQAKDDGPKGDDADETDKHGVREPTPCEVCRILAFELKEQLTKTDKKGKIKIGGHGLDAKKITEVVYSKSEMRFVEVMEQVCSDIEKYNIHAEHKRGVMRYRKHMSETMRTLNGLRLKGVKVELGIPEDLWNSTSAETAKLKRLCDQLLEEAEDHIEEWYMSDELVKEDLIDYLCRQKSLKGKDASCLDEHTDWDPNKQPKITDESKSKKKSKKKKKTEL